MTVLCSTPAACAVLPENRAIRSTRSPIAGFPLTTSETEKLQLDA
jgi:hypothetical protein